jgi:iron only hydrogenase large subunit-like protein
MEVSTELLHSLGIPVKNNAYGIKVNKTKKQNGPLFTSCCPS